MRGGHYRPISRWLFNVTNAMPYGRLAGGAHPARGGEGHLVSSVGLIGGQSQDEDTRSDQFCWLQEVGEADAMKHLGPQPIEHGEANIGAVLGWIDVNTERP